MRPFKPTQAFRLAGPRRARRMPNELETGGFVEHPIADGDLPLIGVCPHVANISLPASALRCISVGHRTLLLLS